MVKSGRLTTQAIEQARPRPHNDRWLSDDIGERNAGRLLLRIAPNGAKRFYFRYTVAQVHGAGAKPASKRIALSLGAFTADPKPNALTLKQARDRADDYRRIHKAPDSRDVRAHFKREEKARAEAERLEAIRKEQASAAADAALRFTVRALVAAYVAHLENKGKRRSAQDARNIFKNHLDTAGARPARELQPRDVTELLRHVVEAGKGRTAAKLRSYLHAAYALAIDADLNPDAPSDFIGFALDTNPVAPVDSLAQFSRAGDRTLSQDELFAYWGRLDSVTSLPARSALRLALLLGGQRPTQLLRLRRADVDMRAGRLMLYDTKGKRSKPRPHELPITEAAKAILEPCMASAAKLESEWVFTTTGKAPTTPYTLTREVRDVAAAMLEKREATEAFSLRDVRRTAETTLASLGVSQDVRAQILSHGLSGIQHKHYDRHDYRPEKREAIERWERWLIAGPTSKVIAG
ncbi:MAG TPA: integrase family protein, partial [Casimicrobiaceae bacterium]